ncbi:hypothetical protein BDV33DRAFT_176723 [Aspergillus novoparasiticus]|uniref:Condensation domain-containing protein n=1 Tax=Aspergillus novoparasiticus TaxID=986946 RepID=A0A5N6EKE7_9EURO|nr:hypothetical protein BDV33DRAFT_176723 [Aspergillus novoparasiticus]
MSWTKVSERRWERPVTGMEGYFVYTGSVSAAHCDGRHQYTIFSKLKVDLGINPADVESALKRAWKRLRSEQPQIATTVDGTTMVYEVPDEAALQEWLASTFVVSSAADAEDLYRNVEPIKQVTLYYIPKSSELVLRAQHYTIDGTGTLLLWDRYLTALATPAEEVTFGDEHTRLAPSIEDVLKVSEPTAEETEKATALLMSYATKAPGVGPVSKVGTVPAGRSQNAEVTFPTRTTEAIVKVCKEKGISVTSAVHAAYIQAIIKHANPNGTLSRYVSLGLFNLRPYLPKPYSTSEYAASVYYTPLPLDFDLPAPFWETAHALDKYYRTTVKDDPEILPLHTHMTRILCQASQMPEYQGLIPGDAQVSSLGIVERYVQHRYGNTVKVLDVKMGVDVVLGMSMFFIYTFYDQLRLVYSFNDGYEEPAHISMYLEEVQKILTEELLA